jgi:hypothetical protein
MEKTDNLRFAFSGQLSVVLIVLLVGVLVSIIAAIVFGLLPLQDRTGFVVPDVDPITVQGQDVVRVQHKGGDTFLLNNSSSSSLSVIGLAIETKAGTEKVWIVPSVNKYTFAPGEMLYIFHNRNGYYVTDAESKVIGPVPFANGTYYLVITDETRKTLIMRLGPY